MKNKLKIKEKYYCINCHKEICSRTWFYGKQRCSSCSHKGKLSGMYIDGRSSKKLHCIDCGKEINQLAKWNKTKRCHVCAGKNRFKNPKNSVGYVDGRSLKKYYCIDCHKQISYNHKRCRRCHMIHLCKISPQKKIIYKNIRLRSNYELFYAKYLDKNKITWSYESKTFDLGKTTYTPDFYLPKTNEYIEVKGWWRLDALKKFNLFKKLYPTIKIKIINKKILKLLKLI
jgi:DNA-directed RNA polymerase subunit RPC12/RpoP